MKKEILILKHLSYWKENNNDCFHFNGLDAFFIPPEVKNSEGFGKILAIRLNESLKEIMRKIDES